MNDTERVCMEVKEKKVELIELFYDLIYVYAISKMTMIIEEPADGAISLSGFFSYLVISFVILQAWLYLTNYVNRYGRWKWHEYALTSVNMTATVYEIAQSTTSIGATAPHGCG